MARTWAQVVPAATRFMPNEALVTCWFWFCESYSLRTLLPHEASPAADDHAAADTQRSSRLDAAQAINR